MNQIIQTLSEKLNLPEAVVRTGVGIILNFLKEKAAGSQFEQFVKLLPGANDLMATAPVPGEAGESNNLLGGLLQKAGGLLGGNLGAAAEAVSAMQGAGVPVDKAGPLASGFFQEAKAMVGPDTVEAVLAQIPALKDLLTTK